MLQTMTKRLLAATLIPIALALPLTGCTTDNSEAFLSVVKVSPEFADSTDEGLIKAARTICETVAAANDGKGWEAASYVASEAGLGDTAAALLIVAGVRAYCPEHTDEIPAEFLAD